MKTDATVVEFECIRCSKEVKIQVVGKVLEEICGECWCKENGKEKK